MRLINSIYFLKEWRERKKKEKQNKHTHKVFLLPCFCFVLSKI